MKVELKYASVPGVFGRIAVHYWFVVSNGLHCDRWEVWHFAGASKISTGNIRKNLLPSPHQSVGRGLSWTARAWHGEIAERIAATIESSGSEYPYRHQYRPWPGPNSNTYIVWVLRRAGVAHRLSWRAFGKRFT